MFTFILDRLVLTLFSIDNCMPHSVPAWFNDACWNRWDDLDQLATGERPDFIGDCRDNWRKSSMTKHERRVLDALSQLHQI